MVLISHRYKFIYLKNYKTAGSSVESFFGQFCIDPSQRMTYVFQDKTAGSITEHGIISPRLSSIPRHSVWFNHKNAQDIKKDIGDTIFNQYIKFCVVRNPYDVVVSSYYWNKSIHSTQSTNFKEYCIKYCNNLSKNYINNDVYRIFLDELPVCQYYIRYENLMQDVEMVLKELGITDYNIQDFPYHKSNIRPAGIEYRSYYDDETKLLVYSVYKKIIDYFGYAF